MPKQIARQSLFPSKLNQILNDSSLQEYIRWGQDKCSIEIDDVKSLQQKVLARFFRHHNFESFARQMNLYGFKKNRGSVFQIFTNIELTDRKNLVDLKSRNSKRRIKMKRQTLRMKQLQEENRRHQESRVRTQQKNVSESKCSSEKNFNGALGLQNQYSNMIGTCLGFGNPFQTMLTFSQIQNMQNPTHQVLPFYYSYTIFNNPN